MKLTPVLKTPLLTLAFATLTSFAAANDNNIQWDFLYHSFSNFADDRFAESVPTSTTTFLEGRADDQVTFADQAKVRVLSLAGDVVSVTLRIHDGTNATLIPMQEIGTVTAPFRNQPSNTYSVWEGTIPAYPANTNINYRFRLVDGSSLAVLKSANGQYINPMGQHVRGFDDDSNDYGYSVTVPVTLSHIEIE